MSFKNTPILSLALEESRAILRHTGDDFSGLMKYGIDNANDLQNAKNLIIGRQATGAAAVSVMSGVYLAGNLSGNGPADRQLKQNWINSGWKPMTLTLGDVEFDYSSLEPFNVIMSTIADIGDNLELMGEEWAEDRLAAVRYVVGRGVTSKSYITGLDQLMQFAQWKPGASGRIMANLLNNSLPLAGARNELGKFLNPYMKELNSDMWDSIRNRNLTSEYISGKPLPNKSDLLNGQPIRDWNIWQRAFNAVSPIQVGIRSKSPGRKLLLNSNYDLRSTTYSYGKYNLAKNADARALFQNAIGNSEVTIGFKSFKNPEEALNYLASRKDVQESMATMERDQQGGNWGLNPTQAYHHNGLIDLVFSQARDRAWARLVNSQNPVILKLILEEDGNTLETEKKRRETSPMHSILTLNNP